MRRGASSMSTDENVHQTPYRLQRYDDSILAAAGCQDRRRFERRLRRQAHALGYELVPEAA